VDVTLINPPEQLRVWAGIPKAMAYGVYCFPPLGLMYIQAAVEKRSKYKVEIFDRKGNWYEVAADDLPLEGWAYARWIYNDCGW
jgi:hypothetical protein